MKTFELKITMSDDNKITMEGTNDGFNAYELLGLLQSKLIDISEQIHGRIQPESIKRTVIVDEKKEVEKSCANCIDYKPHFMGEFCNSCNKDYSRWKLRCTNNE